MASVQDRTGPASGFAIVGYAARFPGSANADEYWQVLREPDYFTTTVTDPTDLMTVRKDYTHVLFFYDDCTVIYGNPKRGIAYTESAIRLINQQPVAIDENGSFYPSNEILSLKNWGLTENISNLLPRDYDVSAPF